MRVQVFIRTKEKLEPGLRKPSNEEETDSIESSNECNLQIKRITSLIQPDLKTEYKEKKKRRKEYIILYTGGSRSNQECSEHLIGAKRGGFE